jgi:uncharacterized Rmd1/YagE family protein
MLKVVSYQVADSIDIRLLRSEFAAEVYRADTDELFYVIGEDKYLYVFKYGIVSLLNYNETEATALLRMLQPYCRNPVADKLTEEFDINIGATRYKLGFNQVDLPDPTPEKLRLIMLNVSQSVAIDHYERQTSLLLEETNRYTQMLEKKGRLNIGSTALKKQIGRTLNLKNRIAENLYIFDSPEETWEDEELNRLDLGLKRTFDLQVRFRSIQDGLSVVKENLELFKDMMQSRNSTLLEWIIILLILVEVVNLLVEKILR